MSRTRVVGGCGRGVGADGWGHAIGSARRYQKDLDEKATAMRSRLAPVLADLKHSQSPGRGRGGVGGTHVQSPMRRGVNQAGGLGGPANGVTEGEAPLKFLDPIGVFNPAGHRNSIAGAMGGGTPMGTPQRHF
jgi:hypothetical protein